MNDIKTLLSDPVVFDTAVLECLKACGPMPIKFFEELVFGTTTERLFDHTTESFPTKEWIDTTKCHNAWWMNCHSCGKYDIIMIVVQELTLSSRSIL